MSSQPWLDTYPDGVPQEIDADKYSCLPDLFQESFNKNTNKPAFENMGKVLSFSEVDRLSTDFGAYLQQVIGLKKGDKVAIQMPNLLQYPVVMFGALRAGLVIVNTNPLYTSGEMRHQFKDSGAKAIVILANFASNLQEIIAETDIETVIITEIGDMLPGFKKTLVNFVVKRVKKMVPKFDLPEAIPFNKALNEGAGYTLDKPKIEGEDLAYLQYTGGTTGVSKGAMLTHRNLIANLMQVNAWMAHGGLKEGQEIFITALPMYHIFALTCNALVSMEIGAKNILITNPRDMKGFVKELSKHQFSVITGVNTLFNGLLNNADFKKLDFSNLKFAFGGGMAVQRFTAEKWQETTGAPLSEGYGLTESSPVLCANPLDGNGRVGYIGLPIPSTQVILIDDDGNEVPYGEKGELCAKGPQVMKGYWNKPEDTKDIFHDGWLKTGDVAVMEADGFLKIVDRKKEMILVSGFNVYPNEVEDAIASHPKVLEVGAIAVPDKKSTEAVKVYIVRSDDSLDEEEIKTFCRENLTGYKCPKHVAFAEELPKSNVGKILRRVIRENDAKENTYN
ncbi:MAG: AMP-binding protein [Cyclobacteriaceae bacterium]|nr:AMP-binding protein [Cyclobacteriaceae bacterium HetDA_MAG_MS6]